MASKTGHRSAATTARLPSCSPPLNSSMSRSFSISIYGATWSTAAENLARWKDELLRQSTTSRVVKLSLTASASSTCCATISSSSQGRRALEDDPAPAPDAAVEKVIARVYDPVKRRGLIWHTQGSGKTLTMITIAAKLLRMPGVRQANRAYARRPQRVRVAALHNIEAYGIAHCGGRAEQTDLQQILRSDYRGLIVSMIHKFDDVPANLNERESVVVLVDEAHRPPAAISATI